jgi:hypothetical protein
LDLSGEFSPLNYGFNHTLTSLLSCESHLFDIHAINVHCVNNGQLCDLNVVEDEDDEDK